MNNLVSYQRLLDEWVPWAGEVPRGFVADFMGTLTDIRYWPMSGLTQADAPGGWVETRLPGLGGGGNGEWWFEMVNWLVSAREARGQYVMMTLGAHYGAQAVCAHRALRRLNPLPCKLVAVEPEPQNFEWLLQHFRVNGIDPADHWLVPLVLSDRIDPVFFPVGAPGTGSNNCFATNEAAARQAYADELIARGNVAAALENLLKRNTTGLTKDLLPGRGYTGEIKLVSAMTLNELLAPFPRVDYIEADMQQSEILVFPPFIELLGRKVRRIHIGTHGSDVHAALHRLFADDGWQIVFSYAPNSCYDSVLGSFTMNDGVLTVLNPRL
jgi:hypothetical protein